MLNKTELETVTYYLISTVGKEGGIMGWVSEEYIYEIVIEPVQE